MRDGFEEAGGRLDLLARRPSVRGRTAGLMRMGRHDVPEQDVLLDPQLGQRAVNDRRRRLRRPAAGEQPLRGERDPRDAGAPVTGGFPDQDDGSAATFFEVGSQPFSPQARTAVLIEGIANRGPGELGYQRSQRTTSSSGRRRLESRSFRSFCIGSGAG